MFKRYIFILCLLSFLQTSQMAASEEVWTVSFAELAEVAYKDHSGIHIDLMKEVAREAGIKLNIKVRPFARSMNEVARKKVDMHIPLLHPETSAEKAPGILSKFRLYYVYFRVYSYRPIKLEDLPHLEVETEATHIPLFKHKFNPSYCIRCSVRKVALKRLDAFVMAERLVQDVIQRENIKGIYSQLYKKFPVRIVFRKDASEELQEKVHHAFLRVIKNGKYKKIMGPLVDHELIKEITQNR